MTPKCDGCPLGGEDRACLGQRNSGVCRKSRRPGVLKQILSFGQAVVQHVAAGRPKATEAQRNARLTICQACEHYDAGRCDLCGCGMALKASWADMSCPVGKWQAIPPTATETSGETH